MENTSLEEIQILMETFDFNQLEPVDRQKVLNVMTESDYSANRKTILASAAMFSEANQYQPKPLVIEQKTHFLTAPIPLYKALIGVAAMVVFMLLLFPIKKIELAEQTVKYVTIYDTIETQIVHSDTVEKFIEKPVFKERIVYVNNSANMALKEEPRLLEVPRNSQDLSFSPETLKNKGVSMKDDTLMLTLPRVY